MPDRSEMVEARKVWRSTHDAGKTLAALRGFHCTERQLLEGLKRCAKNDVVTALAAVRTLSIDVSLSPSCQASHRRRFWHATKIV